MRTKFKAWAKPFILEHSEVSIKEEEFSTLDNFNLEIGSGKGAFIAQMGEKFPLELFIGIEKNETCSGFLAKKLVETKLNNVKMYDGDVVNVLPFIKDKTVKNIFLNFSDPWPKKRHTKRRLTFDTFLPEYKRILKDDGRLLFKSDNDELYQYSLENFPLFGFKIISNIFDYDGLDEFDACSEYEANFRGKGNKIHRLIVVKGE